MRGLLRPLRRRVAITGQKLAARRKVATSPAYKGSSRKILGLPPSGRISADELRSAYLLRVKDAHPDRGGTNEDFRSVQAAYAALKGSLSEDQRVQVETFASSRDRFRDAVKRGDGSLAERLWEDIVADGDVKPIDFESFLDLISIDADALGKLESLCDENIFVSDEAAASCYNAFLFRVNALEETEATMDLILKSLASMDKRGLQPDLALLETQLFTYFPKR